jgi:Urm1 (Ubiquitin related modifier)
MEKNPSYLINFSDYYNMFYQLECLVSTSNESRLIISSGGLEMLFSNERKHHLKLPNKSEDGLVAANIAYLVRYLCDNLMKDKRKELFVLDDAV